MHSPSGKAHSPMPPRPRRAQRIPHRAQGRFHAQARRAASAAIAPQAVCRVRPNGRAVALGILEERPDVLAGLSHFESATEGCMRARTSPGEGATQSSFAKPVPRRTQPRLQAQRHPSAAPKANAAPAEKGAPPATPWAPSAPRKLTNACRERAGQQARRRAGASQFSRAIHAPRLRSVSAGLRPAR